MAGNAKKCNENLLPTITLLFASPCKLGLKWYSTVRASLFAAKFPALSDDVEKNKSIDVKIDTPNVNFFEVGIIF